jgi:proline racemase
MRIGRLISAIDSHAEGENARIVIGGIPHIPGDTMFEKMEYFRDKLEGIWKALVYEPRGWKAMFLAVLTSPTTKEADLGILYAGAPGGGVVFPMGGHPTIAATTVAIETGIIKPVEPVTTVKWDTAAGLVVARAEVKNQRVTNVTFRNVPSFLYQKDIPIETHTTDLKRIEVLVDIAYGGAWTAIVSAKSLGLKIRLANQKQILETGAKMLSAVNEKTQVVHPELPHIKWQVTQIRIIDNPVTPEAHSRNSVVCCYGPGPKSIDRSPCGTGTCAEMAQLYSRNKLTLNQEFVVESIIGTLFKGKLVGECLVGDYEAVVPEITGSAWITGINQFVFDPDDPLKSGFPPLS